MGGSQSWPWTMLASVLIVAGLIFLAYWHFTGSGTRRGHNQDSLPNNHSNKGRGNRHDANG